MTANELQAKLDRLTTELSEARQATAAAKDRADHATDEDTVLSALAAGLLSQRKEVVLQEQVNEAQEELNRTRAEEFATSFAPVHSAAITATTEALDGIAPAIERLINAALAEDAMFTRARTQASSFGNTSDRISNNRPFIQVDGVALRSRRSAIAGIVAGIVAPLFSALQDGQLATELENRRRTGAALSH